MGCRNTSIKRAGELAFTLVEVMVATALAGLVATVVLAFSLFSSRSFLSLTNYADLGLKSQIAIDKMSKEIRQCAQLTAYSSNSITLRDAQGNSLTYTANPSARTLARVANGQTTTLLTGCDRLQFWIYQHTPISNTFECYAPAYVTNARLVALTLQCSRRVSGSRESAVSIQSANVALRNH